MSLSLDEITDQQTNLNGPYTLTYYPPTLDTVTSNATNIQVNRTHMKSFTVPGRHTSESCALQASIYDSNTKFQEKVDIENGIIKQKSGLYYTIQYANHNSKETGMADINKLDTSPIDFNKLASLKTIIWMGYFQPSTTGTYIFNTSNLSVYIGPTALQMNHNTLIDKSFTVTNINEAAIPIRIIYRHNPKTREIKYSLKVSNNNGAIQSTEIFSLFKGCDFYYRSPVLYYLEGNNDVDGTVLKKDGSALKDKNLNCNIVGQLDTKNSYNPIIINTPPTIHNQGVPHITRTSYTTGRGIHRRRHYKTNTTYTQTPTQSFPLTTINTNGIKYTNDPTYVTLNNAIGNPTVGQITITNNRSNDIQFIPTNSKLLDYKNTAKYAKIKDNTFPLITPYGNTNQIELPNSDLSSCVINSSYEFYTMEDSHGLHCYSNTANSLSLLPAQTSQFAASTAYVKIPSLKMNTAPVTYTSQTNSTSIPFSSTSIYKNTTFPDPSNVLLLNKSIQNVSNELLKMQGFTTIKGNSQVEGLEGKKGIATVITTDTTKKGEVTGDNAGELSKTDINKDALNWNQSQTLTKGNQLKLHFKLDSTISNDVTPYRQYSNAQVKRISTIVSNNSEKKIAQVNWKESIPMTNIKSVLKNVKPTDPISFQVQVKSNLLSKNVTAYFDIINISSPSESIRVTLESYNKILKNITAILKINNKNYKFVKPIPKSCMTNSWINAIVIIDPSTKQFIVSLNGETVINESLKDIPNIQQFGNIILGSNSITAGNNVSNEVKGLAGGAAAAAAFGPIGWVAAAGMGIAALVKGLKKRKPNYGDSFNFSDFKIYTENILNKIEKFSTINVDTMVSPYSLTTESFTNYKEGLDALTTTTQQDILLNKLKQDVNRYSILNKSYQSTLDNVNANLDSITTNLPNYHALLQQQKDNMDIAEKKGVLYQVDVNGQVVPKATNPTAEVVKDDLNELIIQQNTVYVTGTIACATLLIAAIMIGSK